MAKWLAAVLLAGALTSASAAPRAPAVAGRFYPAKAKELAALVVRQLAAAPPVALAAQAKLIALLVPHAGLSFSGETAARAYAALKKGSFDSVLIVGTCHYKELEGAALYPGDYATPEGSLPYDEKLGRTLMAASPLIKADAAAHKKEHSIEVQLPYLRRQLGRVPMVALVMNTQDLETARKIGQAIALAAAGRRVLLVASSDQSHYPSGEVADAVDRTTLLALETLDPAYFWLTNRFLMNRGLPDLSVTYCGEGAVTAVLAAARELGATTARVLAHINSGDVVSEREYNHVVGYAAALLISEPGARPARAPLSKAQKEVLLRVVRQAVSDAASGRPVKTGMSPEPAFNLPAAVFVTLRSSGGELRGCLGTTQPQESLIEAAARFAGLAATADKRFKPVSAEEAPRLRVEVSVLSPGREARPEEIKSGDGVALEAGGKSGVFLPDVWKTLTRREDFLAALCEQKAGLKRDCWTQPGSKLSVFGAEVIGD